MHKNPSFRLFIVPALVLAGLIALFTVVEFRKLSDDASVRLLINDPVPTMAFQMEQAAWRLGSLIEMHRPSNSMAPENMELLVYGLDDLAKRESILTAFFLQDAFEAEEHLAEMDMLRSVTEEIGRIRRLLPEKLPFERENWRDIKARFDALMVAVQDLNLSISATHQKEANRLLGRIASAEKQRAVMAVMVLLSGFVLILVLLNAVQHYKSNAERAMAAERYNALFGAALESTRVGVLIRDMRKKNRPVIFVNRAFCRMTGYELSDLSGDTSEFLFGWRTDPGAIAAFRRAVSLRETATFDILIYRKDGSPFWSEWHLSPVLDANGELTHFVSLFNDTTGLRQAQEDLIQAKEMAERASAIKTSFLAMMSHEIRTPINGILGVLRLLRETSLDVDQRHLLSIAITSSDALHGIINDILDFAKLEAGRVEVVPHPFSLREIFNEVCELVRPLIADKALALEVEVQADLPPRFLGDAGRLRQIILNLLGNAIKFTESGSVRVRTTSMMPQEVDGRSGMLLRIEVIDTGIGIAPEDQEKLFKEFSQIERSYGRRFGGTGLGLAICKRLVSLMGGEIGLESQPGKGSKFWFMIPLVIASEADETPEVGTDGNAGEGRRFLERTPCILLVEDNETNRLVASRYLLKAGFQVEEAVNGLEAVQKARTGYYDAILMDVSMPEMDGLTATCKIRALGSRYTQLPIIALTAHVMAGDRELCLSAGMNDFLNKPLDYETMVRTLNRWLHIAQPPIVAPLEEGASQVDSGMGMVLSVEPVLDAKVLDRMRNDLGKDAVLQVANVFLRDSASRLEAFKTGADRGAIREQAHTLKSCSGNCGLKRLSVLMAMIETAAVKGDWPQVETLLQQVDPTYAEGRDRLVQELQKYTA